MLDFIGDIGQWIWENKHWVFPMVASITGERIFNNFY